MAGVVTSQEVKERDGFRCIRVSCERLGGALHAHHRILRSQGGPDTSENQVTLCTHCHRWVHANPYAARREGLLLKRHDDPAAIPVDHIMFPLGPVLLGEELDFIIWTSEMEKTWPPASAPPAEITSPESAPSTGTSGPTTPGGQP